MAREPEPDDRPPAVAKIEEREKSFSAACLRYLKNRGRRPG
jgi:hypothetical protein